MVFKKIIFQNRYVALETGLDPPFMANAILNFHFDFLHPSLIMRKLLQFLCGVTKEFYELFWFPFTALIFIQPVHEARARKACALRALGLLLADGAPTVGRGKTFWRVNRIFFFTKTAVTPEHKVEKSFPVGNEPSLRGL